MRFIRRCGVRIAYWVGARAWIFPPARTEAIVSVFVACDAGAVGFRMKVFDDMAVDARVTVPVFAVIRVVRIFPPVRSIGVAEMSRFCELNCGHSKYAARTGKASGDRADCKPSREVFRRRRRVFAGESLPRAKINVGIRAYKAEYGRCRAVETDRRRRDRVGRHEDGPGCRHAGGAERE